MKDLIIIGAGGHGRVVADIALKLKKYENISFLDDGKEKTVMGLRVIGDTADIEKYVKIADIFVAIGNSIVRRSFMERLFKLGASVPSLVHPSAIIGFGVEIGDGTAIMAGTVINPCSRLGKGIILNTASSIDHDCEIGDYSHVAVGVSVAGTVKLGENVWLGAGSTIKNNVSICADVVIGAGAVVVKDIIETGTYVGVPARLAL